MFVRRLGGGFGAKIVRQGILAGATALAASKLQKPVRMWMNISDNMDIIGKRFPCYSEYTVAVNGNGVVQSLTVCILHQKILHIFEISLKCINKYYVTGKPLY